MSENPVLLHPGAVEHYQDARSYEQRYAARTEDVRFYLNRVGRGGRVLEYGAGAGRLTLPLLKKGAKVMAVDTSFAMLDLLRERSMLLSEKQRGGLLIKQGDMRTFRTSQRFEFVVSAFHTVGHLYSNADISSFLRRAFAHLAKGGKILFDLPLPRIDMPEYDAIAGVRVTEMDGPKGPQLLTQRWYQPAEIQMHLHYAGFEKMRLYSDFSAQPLDRETSVYAVSAQRP